LFCTKPYTVFEGLWGAGSIVVKSCSPGLVCIGSQGPQPFAGMTDRWGVHRLRVCGEGTDSVGKNEEEAASEGGMKGEGAKLQVEGGWILCVWKGLSEM
jgi:hypothetical protein